MAVNALIKLFRLHNIFRAESSYAYYSTQQIKQFKYVPLILLQENKILPDFFSNHIQFDLRFINLQPFNQINRVFINKSIKCPTQFNRVFEDPIKNNVEEIDILPNKVIEIPMNDNILEKQAVRLIVIRRKKIKKHKRKKFLKRMHAVILKREARKKQLKKKIFEAELKAMTSKAEKFDARDYVKQRIELLTRTKIPNKYRGEQLPQEMILQFLTKKEEKKKYKQKLHNYKLKID